MPSLADCSLSAESYPRICQNTAPHWCVGLCSQGSKCSLIPVLCSCSIARRGKQNKTKLKQTQSITQAFMTSEQLNKLATLVCAKLSWLQTSCRQLRSRSRLLMCAPCFQIYLRFPGHLQLQGFVVQQGIDEAVRLHCGQISSGQGWWWPSLNSSNINLGGSTCKKFQILTNKYVRSIS